MPAVQVTVKLSGPLFRDAPQRVRAVMQATVQELIELGEQRLDLMLRPRPGGVYLSVAEAQKGKASTGHYRRSVHSRRSGRSRHSSYSRRDRRSRHDHLHNRSRLCDFHILLLCSSLIHFTCRKLFLEISVYLHGKIYNFRLPPVAFFKI